MANGLEVRAPLLDHELMEFVATMPSRLKLRGRTGKHILKQVALGFLPPPLVHRKKMGFSVPLDAWFRTLLRPIAKDLLLTPTSRIGEYFRPDAVRRLWDEHQSGWRNHGTGLWVLLTLESWHRRYLG
jgi:asparagine synthase (glutamine-hydrolysing)